MPKLWEALITLLILVAVLSIGIVIFGASVHVPMFVGVCAAALMACIWAISGKTLRR